nr:hypothetical protein [Nitrosomonas nitrosa]
MSAVTQFSALGEMVRHSQEVEKDMVLASGIAIDIKQLLRKGTVAR